MPWRTTDLLAVREEFVRLASAPGANKRELMRRFGISPPTGYKWLKRYGEGGVEALADRSRRPLKSPAKTSEEIERLVVGAREEFPVWGGRKLARLLSNRGMKKVPAPSTITEILRRPSRSPLRRGHFADQGAVVVAHHQQAEPLDLVEFVGVEADVIEFAPQVGVPVLEEFDAARR